MQHHERQLAVHDEDVRAAAEKTVGYAGIFQQAHHFGYLFVSPKPEFVRGAADSERGKIGQSDAGTQLDT
jgi:hypothetical protein